QALAQGKYDIAFDLLEKAARRQFRRRERAFYRLHLAGLYALYGDDGLQAGTEILAAVLAMNPGLAETPLFIALDWEFQAIAGATVEEVVAGVAEVMKVDDVEARYHAANALYTAGALDEAQAALMELAKLELPVYLTWRTWSLL